jgi:hypothetical protein
MHWLWFNFVFAGFLWLALYFLVWIPLVLLRWIGAAVAVCFAYCFNLDVNENNLSRLDFCVPVIAGLFPTFIVILATEKTIAINTVEPGERMWTFG